MTVNGGPAFPVDTTVDDASGEYGHQTGHNTWQCPGMTLLDYFAAKALAPLYADALAERAWTQSDQWQIGIARDAYSMADAMLKARAAINSKAAEGETK